MIGPPVNDEDCLEPITEVVRQLVDNQDPDLLAVVAQYPSPELLAEHIRSLPQRDDLGDPYDGPKVRACRPPQRLRIPAKDPNCVERTALWTAGAEILNPGPIRQLVTIDTPWGMHTMPVEQNEAVILDPNLPRNAVCGALFAAFPARYPMTLSEGVDWLATIAVRPAHTAGTLDRVQAAQEAMHSVLARYIVSPRDLDDVAYTAALARREAVRWGARAPALVEEIIEVLRSRIPRQSAHTTLNGGQSSSYGPTVTPMCGQPSSSVAVGSDLAHRNFSISIGGTTLRPDTALLAALAKIGLRLGATAAAPAVMAKLGLPLQALQVIEGELNKDGHSLGPVLGSIAKPLFPSLGTISGIRNATPSVPIGALLASRNIATRNIATPGETLTELRITDADIKALGRDIYLAFRRPFEQQLAAAEARFERETGRRPRNEHHEDYAKVHSYMNPIPTAADIEWKTYQGNFVHGWGDFERGWEQFLADRDGWFSRLPGTGSYDQALDRRTKAQEWRTKFEALGGVTHTPTPTAPVKPPDALDRASERIGRGAKTGLIALAAVTGAALVLPPLLRRRTSQTP